MKHMQDGLPTALILETDPLRTVHKSNYRIRMKNWVIIFFICHLFSLNPCFSHSPCTNCESERSDSWGVVADTWFWHVGMGVCQL